MPFLTETPFIAGIIVTILSFILVFVLFKPSREDISGIRDWTGRENWSGNVVNAEIQSWVQTDAKYGNDFFYDFEVSVMLHHTERTLVGKGLVRPDDIHKLKRGLKAVVKYNEDHPPRVAILEIAF